MNVNTYGRNPYGPIFQEIQEGTTSNEPGLANNAGEAYRDIGTIGCYVRGAACHAKR